MTELDKYNESLDRALVDYMRGKESSFDEHCQRFNLADKIPADPFAKRGSVMKMVTAKTNLPMWARCLAKRWLENHGFQSWDDGDIVLS
jgi:hypothetical protein